MTVPKLARPSGKPDLSELAASVLQGVEALVEHGTRRISDLAGQDWSYRLVDLRDETTDTPSTGVMSERVAEFFANEQSVVVAIVSSAFAEPLEVEFPWVVAASDLFHTKSRTGYLTALAGDDLPILVRHLFAIQAVNAPAVQVAVASSRRYFTDIDLHHGIYASQGLLRTPDAYISPNVTLETFCRASELGVAMFVGEQLDGPASPCWPK